MKLALDPEIENGMVMKIIGILMGIYAIVGMIFSWILIPSCPDHPDLLHGSIMPIPHHGGFLYLTKFQYSLYQALPLGGFAFSGAAVLLLFLMQIKRNFDHKKNCNSACEKK